MQNPVRKIFNSIAPRYDLINDLLSFGIHRSWLKKAVRKIPIEDNYYILDLATGTGNFAFEFIKANPNVKVVGMDIAEQMIKIAQQKNEKFSGKVKFQVGDATNIPFQDNYFNVVSISYGIRNIQNMDRCFAEIHRVLKPNGYLVIVEFGLPSNLFRKIYRLYQNLFIVKFGGFISKNSEAYSYFVQSVNSFPYGENFVQKIQETNLFHSVRYFPLTFGVAYIYICQARKNN